MQPAAVDLAQLRGKVVLVFFWSTDCPVCLDKLPELRRNLEGWRGKDFVIVAVSQDRSMADLKAYEQVLERVAPVNAQMKIVWRRDGAHRDSFGELPANIPTTIVLDRRGAVVKSIRGRVPPDLWDDIAELVLN
jgi:peroxiredoxin